MKIGHFLFIDFTPEDNYLFGILHFRKRKKDIYTDNGEGSVNDQIHQKWFHIGDFLY